MTGAIFMSILASPALANLRDTAHSVSTEQLAPASGDTRAPMMSTARLTEMLEASVEDLEAYSIDLQSQKTLSERHRRLLEVMDSLVDDVSDIFVADATELAPVEKVSLARRIVENNVKIAKRKLATVQTHTEDGVEVAFSPEEKDATPTTYAQLAAGRQEIMQAIEETKVDIDYIVDEIAKFRDENTYYSEALQEATNLFEKVLFASQLSEASLQGDFSALKNWQREFRDEMSTTDESFSASTR